MRRRAGIAIALLMLVGGAVAAPKPAEAAGDPGGFFDGLIKYSQIYNCISIIQSNPYVEYGAGAYVGAYADPDEATPVPAANQTFYMHVVVYGLGNSCAGQRFVPAIDLPSNVQLDTTQPIICFFGSTQATSLSDCPQWGNVSGSAYGGDYMYNSTDNANAHTWPLPQGGSWEFRFPVRSTTTQTSAPLGAFVKMFDGNNNPVLNPTSPLYVFGGDSVPSILYDQPSTVGGPFIPGTSIVPKWGIYSTANIFTDGVAGTGAFDIGTSPGSYSQTVTFALGAGSWAVSNDWDEPSISPLVGGTTYYWRARFIPSSGPNVGQTFYGAQQSFTRPASTTPPAGPLPPPPVPPAGFPPPPPPTPPSSGFTSLTPARLLDSRSDGITVDGQYKALGRRGAGSITQVKVTGRGGVPANAAAVSLNVTAANTTERGFLTVYPCGGAVPGASNLNYQPGVNLANAVISKVGTGGKVCIFTKAPIDLIIDVNGSIKTAAGFTSLTPARLLDSRSDGITVDGQYKALGRRGAGSITQVKVTGRGGVPANAAAVSLNVTAANTTERGFLTVYPCGGAVPGASNLNYQPGVNLANAVISKVGTGGKVCIFTKAPIDLIIDVNGSIKTAAGFTSLTPARLLDSRSDGITVDGQYKALGRRGAGSITQVKVTGRGGVPANAAAVSLNVTAANTTERGFLTVYPCGGAVPGASNLNYQPGVNLANAVISKVGTGGKVCIFTKAPIDLIIDVNVAIST